MRFGKSREIFENRYIKFFIFIVLLYIIFPSYLLSNSYLCENSTVEISKCLDQSWVLSINWAIEKHLIFGKDYIFTYGPLGFLATRTALGLNPYIFLIFDLFIIANFAFIFYYILRYFYSLENVVLTFLIVLSTTNEAMFVQQIVFILLLFSIFWLNYFLKGNYIFSLIIPVVITTILFYIKVNISFISLIIFYGYLIYFIFNTKEKRLAKVSLGLLLPCLIILLSFPLRTDLSGYILGGLSLIDGYNDAMNIEAGRFLKFTFIAVFMLLIFLLGFYRKNIKENLPLLLTCGIFSYILFKQSFVRSDMHIIAFFSTFPFICGLTLLFYKKVSFIQKYLVAGICLVCLVTGLWFDIYPNIGSRVNYFTSLSRLSEHQQQFEQNFNRFTIPEEARNIIGSQTVDVIPWNIDYIYFNRLNYNPRPVIQSYSVYTPYLLNLNSNKYEDSSAPDFVLFSDETIDGRYAFFDDQAAKLSLIKNYTCRGLFNSDEDAFLLFQKTPHARSIELSSPQEAFLKFEEDYLLPDINKSYFIRIDVDYSLLGKAVRFAYKPFPIVMKFTLEDGSIIENRVVIPIIKNGVLINPLIENEQDFLNYVEGRSAAPNKKIKSISIKLFTPKAFVKVISSQTFNSTIRLSVSEISIYNKN